MNTPAIIIPMPDDVRKAYLLNPKYVKTFIKKQMKKNNVAMNVEIKATAILFTRFDRGLLRLTDAMNVNNIWR